MMKRNIVVAVMFCVLLASTLSVDASRHSRKRVTAEETAPCRIAPYLCINQNGDDDFAYDNEEEEKKTLPPYICRIDPSRCK